MRQINNPPRLVYVINVDWYFKLHWLNRATAAQTNGFKVYLLTSFVTQGIKEDLESLGFVCIHVKLSRSGMNIIHELQTAARIYQNLKSIGPAIVHTITVKPNIYAGIAANILAIPAIKSITGLGVIFSNQTFFFRLFRPLIISLYRLAGIGNKGAFVFENEDNKILFKKNRVGKNQRLIHIPGAGVNTGQFVFSPKPFNHHLKILFAARLIKDKGLDTLIEAVSKVKSQGIQCDLLVAGIFDPAAKDAYSPAEINALVSKRKIQWLGRVDDMPSLLERIDVVALPTRYGEGIPRILIEAGAVGRLVITTNISGCKELIQHNENGLLVEPNDSKELSSKLCTIAQNPDNYFRLVKNLYQKILICYSDETVISHFLTLYKTWG